MMYMGDYKDHWAIIAMLILVIIIFGLALFLLILITSWVPWDIPALHNSLKGGALFWNIVLLVSCASMIPVLFMFMEADDRANARDMLGVWAHIIGVFWSFGLIIICIGGAMIRFDGLWENDVYFLLFGTISGASVIGWAIMTRRVIDF